jgi:hypothetical protein
MDNALGNIRNHDARGQCTRKAAIEAEWLIELMSAVADYPPGFGQNKAFRAWLSLLDGPR